MVAPEEMPDRLTVCAPAPSLTVTFASVLSVGAWLTALTVTVKVKEPAWVGVPESTPVASAKHVPKWN